MKLIINLVFWSIVAFRLAVMYIIWQAQLEVETQWLHTVLVAGVMCYLVATIRRIIIFFGVLD